MNAMTPIPPGSFIQIEKTDEKDPESSIVAFLVKPIQVAEGLSGPDPEYDFVELGNSFGAEENQFRWMVSGLAAFHQLPIAGGE